MAISDDILDQLIDEAKTQEDLFGKDGLLKKLNKRMIERMLDVELTQSLGYKKILNLMILTTREMAKLQKP